jgi:hypothetical protein
MCISGVVYLRLIAKPGYEERAEIEELASETELYVLARPRTIECMHGKVSGPNN